MKPLLQKEVRLLLPAYSAAMLLAVAPVWLLRTASEDTAIGVSLSLFILGVVLLALSPFGREFSLHTFPLILAQPLERGRIWWTKVWLLACAMSTALAAWGLSCVISRFAASPQPVVWREALTYGATAVVVAFAGGLWSTLLVRQVTAAFWFAVGVPMAILTVGLNLGAHYTIYAALGLYSVGTFIWAWHQFSRAQETAWTGGVVAFSGWRSGQPASQPARRTNRPRAALFWKELQLHQVGLAGMAWLFVLHLGVVLLRKLGAQALSDTARMFLENFGALWLLIPLLIASASVAEERKLGTMQANGCLPVSGRIQFAVKLLLALGLGGLLSAALFSLAEGVANTLGVGLTLGTPSLSRLLLVFFPGLALLGFYASTLTRNIIHGLATAVVTTMAVWAFGLMISSPFLALKGFLLWHGGLGHYIAWPTLIATFTWLAWRNFRSGAEAWGLWRRNALGLGTALFFICGSTTVLYHRAWELVMPLEPAHGQARLAGPNPTTLYSYGGPGLAVLLPDGRLWVDRVVYDSGRHFLALGEGTGFNLGGHWASLSGNQILPGSNWVDVVASFSEMVAIRADGTLWVSEKPRQFQEWWRHTPSPEEPAPLVRLGSGTNWQSVVRDSRSEALWVVLLKKDGTMGTWSRVRKPGLPWGEKSEWARDWPKAEWAAGKESGWARIMSSGRCIYAWRQDGSTWILSVHSKEHPVQGEPEFGMGIQQWPALDNLKLKNLAYCWPIEVGIQEDGTLWAWNPPPLVGEHSEGAPARPPEQIGKDKDWKAVAGDYRMLVALKTNGSLWKWDFGRGREEQLQPARTSPVRLGTHTDWVAIGNAMEGIVSLAADGGLWYWSNPNYSYAGVWESMVQPMFSASRKPSKIENILGQGE